MPELNIDDQFNEQFPPISVVVDGVTYTIRTIDADAMKAIMGIADNPATVADVFTLITGAKANTFKKTDTRKLSAALRFITETMREQIEAVQSKNVPGEGARPPQ